MMSSIDTMNNPKDSPDPRCLVDGGIQVGRATLMTFAVHIPRGKVGIRRDTGVTKH